MANTTMRSFRIDDELYARMKEHAEQSGVTLTNIVTGAFEMILDGTIDVHQLACWKND